MTAEQSDPADLTPKDAARLMGLSRPAVLRLIAQGTLRSRMVAGEPWLRAAELLAWQEGSAATRREALAALSRLSEAHDL
jgi:excisionase family DNA binding protein